MLFAWPRLPTVAWSCALVALAAPAKVLAAPADERDSSAVDAAAAEDAAVDPREAARGLYRDGERAYWLGDFDGAIERFEAAYALAPAPGMLYNVGLAYLRRGTMRGSSADLRRASAVLRNYLEADGDGRAEPAQIAALIAEAEVALEAAEAAEAEAARRAEAREHEAAAQSAAREASTACAEERPAVDPRGRRMRSAGVGILGASGLLLAAGGVTAGVFAIKGQEFESTMAGLVAQQEEAGCEPADPRAVCVDLRASVATTVDNGYRANLLAGGLGGGLMALGAVGLVAGGILHAKGRGSERAERPRLSLTPSAGGLIVGGRF